MKEAEATEIQKNCGPDVKIWGSWIDTPAAARQFGKAEGYLEAIEKAKGLEEAVSELLYRVNFDSFTWRGNKQTRESNFAKEALAKWEAEK